MVSKINLREKLDLIERYWDPKIVGVLNGQHVKLAKFKGAFVAHRHEKEDEMFLVIKGSFRMELPDKTLDMNEGELVIIPRGTMHRPVADNEAHVLLFEPESTVNTGEANSDRRIDNPGRI